MLEPWRSRYLQSMGVDVYVARIPLVGAAPSIAPDWDELELVEVPSAATACTEIAGIIDDGRLSSASSASTRPLIPAQVEPAIAEQPQAALEGGRRRIAAEETAVGRPLRPARPRFALQLTRSDVGVLVVDAAPGDTRARGDYQRLLANLLFALYSRPVQLITDLFIWPMVKNPAVDQGEAAARESVGACVQRQCNDGGCHTVFLLGDVAAHWVASDLPVRRAGSIWPCIGDGAAKRALWRQLGG